MSHSHIILAVVGLPGAGKTEAIHYLEKRTRWPKVDFGGVILNEVKRRALEINEANERLVREEIRSKYGMGACARLSMDEIKNAFSTSSVLIESHYSWEEYVILKKEFGDRFQVLAVVASPDTRTKRMAERPTRPLTEAETVSRDYSQIENTHQGGPIARADYFVINEGSKEELQIQIDEVLKKLERYAGK